MTWGSSGLLGKVGGRAAGLEKSPARTIHEAGRGGDCLELLAFPQGEIYISKGIWLLFSILVIHLS